MGLPQLAGIDIVNLFPNRRIDRFLGPAGHMALEEGLHLPGHPAGDVNTVGDMADRNLGLRLFLGPQAAPHVTRHLPMQTRDRVDVAGEIHPEDGHAEVLVRVGGVLASQSHQRVVRKPQLLAEGAEVLFDQGRVKVVVTGDHGGMGGEDRLLGHLTGGVLERHPVVVHLLANHLQRGEGVVPLVEVIDAGGDSQGPQRAHPADPRDNLLTDTGAVVPAVEGAGQLSVLLGVLFHIGIEKVEIDAADGHLADAGVDRPVRGLDLDGDLIAVLVERRFQGDILDLRVDVLFLLPPLGVEILTEITLIVEQADRHQRNPQAAGAFDVVAGQNPQTARIDRNRLVETKLQREIGDRLRTEDPDVLLGPDRAGRHILDHAAIRLVDPGVQGQLVGAGLQPFGGELFQKGDRVVAQLTPAGRLNRLKNRHHLGVPAPPHIVGQSVELLVNGRRTLSDTACILRRSSIRHRAILSLVNLCGDLPWPTRAKALAIGENNSR